jgi:hypothetical protein
MKCRDTWVQECRNAETRFKGKINKVHPTVRINWNMIGRLLFSLTVNSSVTNLLVKWIHDCELLAFQLLGQLSSFCRRRWEVEPTVRVYKRKRERQCVVGCSV